MSDFISKVSYSLSGRMPGHKLEYVHIFQPENNGLIRFIHGIVLFNILNASEDRVIIAESSSYASFFYEKGIEEDNLVSFIEIGKERLILRLVEFGIIHIVSDMENEKPDAQFDILLQKRLI